MDKYPHQLVLESLDNFFVKVLLLFVSATTAFIIGMSAIVYYIPYDNKTILYTSDTQLTYNGCMSINPVFYIILGGIAISILYFLLFRDD